LLGLHALGKERDYLQLYDKMLMDQAAKILSCLCA